MVLSDLEEAIAYYQTAPLIGPLWRQGLHYLGFDVYDDVTDDWRPCGIWHRNRAFANPDPERIHSD